jgi:hypothetical protein
MLALELMLALVAMELALWLVLEWRVEVKWGCSRWDVLVGVQFVLFKVGFASWGGQKVWVFKSRCAGWDAVNFLVSFV